MSKYVIFLLIATSTVLAKEQKECVCTLEYKPVCGVDNNSYDNSCEAHCKDIKINYEGICDKKSKYHMNVVQKNTAYSKDNRIVDKVSQKEIENKNTGFAPDLLKGLNGVLVQQTGAGQASPFLRGLTGQHILILFDGIRVNNSIFRYGPNQYSSTFDSFMIGQIELLKGSESTLYGSDAVGGVISLSSKKVRKDGVNGVLGYNSANNGNILHLDVTKKNIFCNIASLNLGVTANNTQNLVAGGNYKQDFTSFRYYALNSKLKLDLRDMGKITLFGSYFTQKDGFRTDKSKLTDYRQYPNQNHGIYYLKYKNYLNSIKTAINFTIYYQTTYEEYKRFKTRDYKLYLSDHRIDDLKQFGITTRATSKISDKINLYTGFESFHDYLKSNKNYFNNSHYNMFSLFSKGEYKLDSLLLGLGTRYTFVKLQKVQDVEYSKNDISFTLFAQYFINNNYNISLNISQGFRAPNLNDLTGNMEFNGGYELGNSDLISENAYMFELVNKYNTRNISLAASLYYTILTDFIGRKVIDTPKGYEEYDLVVEKTNLNGGYMLGGELSFLYRFNDLFNIKTAVSYTYGVMDEIINKKTLEVAQNPMRRIPPLMTNFRLNYKLNDNLSIYYKSTYSAKQDRLSEGDKLDSRIPEGGTPSFFVNSIGANLDMKSYKVTLLLDNLFDEKYKYHGSGVYQAGRSFLLKVIATF